MKDELLAKIEAVKLQTLQSLPALKNLKELQDFKVHVLGKKGLLTEILKGLGGLTPEERPLVGQAANKIKTEIESQLMVLQQSLEASAQEQLSSAKALDITLPGLQLSQGFRHPLSLVQEELSTIFLNLGFSIYEGPEVETDYYNFEALNFPADHPAREMQDTFYITSPSPHPLPSREGDKAIFPPPPKEGGKVAFPSPLEGGGRGRGQSGFLLRTHTSPVQIRAMQAQKPPLYMIAPGAVYRHDDDVTHSPMFHQIEGLMVDINITFADLKGVLTLVCQTIFGKERKVRFRPSFFPFVEPGAEVDISCGLCSGKGCRVCGGDGWLEILGAGMVHPEVLKEMGVDPKKYTGFAFGMGIERIAMLKYSIDDIRLFYQSDLRFLRQF